MNLLHNNISILFKSAKPEHIKQNDSNSNLSFKKIDETLYVNYAREYYQNKSENELLQQYQQMKENVQDKNFFHMLSEFGEQSIDVSNGVPCVKFDNITTWRELTHKIGQSVIVTAFLAKKNLCDKTKSTYFAWPTTLKTNNRSLQNMLNNGTSENHYHLNGSAQIFPITWVCLMNNPSIISSRMKKLGKDLTPYTSFGYEDNRTDWVSLLKEAAKIRLELFCKINHPYFNTLDNNEPFVSSINLEKTISTINFYNGYKSQKCNDYLDYAISRSLPNLNYKNNVILVGERKFLYDCFTYVFCDKFSYEEKNAFYKYLLIKHNFRAEIIQNNNYTGFKNFANYQDRKGYFIDGIEKYEIEAVRTSLNDVLEQQSIISLEARIMPRNNASVLLKHINFYDTTFGKQEFYPYYYVLHYPKGISVIDNKEKDIAFQKPRNYKQRIKYKECSTTTIKALSCIPALRDRIFGIDACSNEIGCRPEVFATEYRYLKNCSFKNNSDFYISNSSNIVLGRTYHVGEDFLELLDGLRAIDEVIHFLDFSYGDRLGHALALGINPSEYYNYKGYITVLSSQDALDNFVWLLNRSNEMNISIKPILKQKIESWIQELSLDIYGDFIKKLNDYTVKTDAYSLYNSWKLRGDNPELYRTMLFRNDNLFNEPYKKAMFKDDDELNALRKRKEISTLYYAYHFDYSVKKNGEKPYEFHIIPEYIELVEKIQNKLKFEIAQKGIMIECNPSSNCLIGTFKDYYKHPITTFNNLHLETDMHKLSKCPQISVSINTDDQGVFDTSLEYEYALMASALINVKNEDGTSLYSPTQVYEYLDSVRKMGNVQSFRAIKK